MLRFTVVDPATLTDPAPNATDAEIRLATQAGREAYHCPSAPSAPSGSPVIRSLIGADTPVGQPRTVQIFAAFTKGWNEAAVAVIETEQA